MRAFPFFYVAVKNKMYTCNCLTHSDTRVVIFQDLFYGISFVLAHVWLNVHIARSSDDAYIIYYYRPNYTFVLYNFLLLSFVKNSLSDFDEMSDKIV